MMTAEVVFGLEACVAQPPALLRSARFGLLMNRASVDRQLRSSCDVLGEAFPNQIAALLTPQHGLWGDAQANMIETGHGWHRELDVPIHSLYCETRRPTSEMLAGLDCLVVDLQDVGTRVYTFIWTVLECLRACADAGLPMLVLDRPNPIGGQIVEGPLLDSDCQSFVGGASIPMRHGLTIGEMARLLAVEAKLDVTVEIVPMLGWSPDLAFAALSRHWLPPSPNLPRIESTLVYPGQVLLEGTNLSEGRGTTTPFEIVGAPFIDPEVLLSRLTDASLPGVRFLPVYFCPTFDKWRDQRCGGVSIHVTDLERFRSFATSIAVLQAVHRQWPDDFRWLDPPYEYETVKPPIDIIYGSRKLRQCLGSAESSRTLAEVDIDAWSERIEAARIYGAGADRFCG
jgi:uncharacterized protein YbbC (DUF1343 family)